MTKLQRLRKEMELKISNDIKSVHNFIAKAKLNYGNKIWILKQNKSQKLHAEPLRF